jgi:hypothetical protein
MNLFWAMGDAVVIGLAFLNLSFALSGLKNGRLNLLNWFAFGFGLSLGIFNFVLMVTNFY